MKLTRYLCHILTMKDVLDGENIAIIEKDHDY